MPGRTFGQTPSLSTFLRSLRTNNIESSIELLISLLKRRQIKNSRPCALATAQLFLRIVAAERIRDAQKLIDRIRSVGRRLVAAQPRELVVGNIVRRVLGVVREMVKRDEESRESVGSEESLPASPAPGGTKRPALPHYNFSSFSPLKQGIAMPYDSQPRPRTPGDSSPAVDGSLDAIARRPGMPISLSYAGTGPQTSSLLSFLEHPLGKSPAGSGAQTPTNTSSPHRGMDGKVIKEILDIKAEVIDGIKELLDELDVVDTQIAESALDHIHSGETILTYGSSQTVQKFLLTAAKKRKFTVFHAEAYPNDHLATHATIVNGSQSSEGQEERWKPLTSTNNVTVILIPDTAAFALMSRINKVLLSPHTVLANGSLLATAGTATIAAAAQAHRVPVVVLAGVYKLSPIYPFDTQELIEYGDPGKVVGFEDGEFMEKVDVTNPVLEWVGAEDVDLYVTNLEGGCAPGFVYRIVGDHYWGEDVEL